MYTTGGPDSVLGGPISFTEAPKRTMSLKMRTLPYSKGSQMIQRCPETPMHAKEDHDGAVDIHYIRPFIKLNSFNLIDNRYIFLFAS